MRYFNAWKLVSRGCEEWEVPWVVGVTSPTKWMEHWPCAWVFSALPHGPCSVTTCPCSSSFPLHKKKINQHKPPPQQIQFWKKEMRFLLLIGKLKLMNHGVLVLDLLTYCSPKGNYMRASEYVLKIKQKEISSHYFLCSCKFRTCVIIFFSWNRSVVFGFFSKLKPCKLVLEMEVEL